ncbi:kinase-like protein [Macroventuria anomochaeta]|uniref:Kinase-like protein n=1 Tax=Macroventuria anomochaeta TaxID=301207 RepID=A0ACB6RTW8_9PLEO|nr:kinase-like protein [Macroventuria anomochaeta]KAF2624584.1 kinase-like protein [Macroventuria anomochaeta]
MAPSHLNPDVPSITSHSDENTRPRKRSRHIDLDGMSSADFGLPRYGSSTRDYTPLWANLKTSEGTQSPKRDQIDPISFRDGYAQVLACDIAPTPNSVGNLTPQTPGHRDSKLHTLLHAIHRPDLFEVLLEAGVTDFWLPLPKRLASKWLKNQELANFLWHQEVSLAMDIPAELHGSHLSITDFEQLSFQETDQELDFLGAGGFGEVFRVKRQLDGQEYACKSMIRRGTYKMQRDLMLNFEREVSGMRKVQHQHCVDLVASCTSMDSVYILSSPVADVDLARFLDLDLDSNQLCVLSGAVGCIASALAYLHKLGIRHDDLKPNNVLIHGPNVLLTDFGFCLDASDTGITTTMGPPKHFTRRYSAPEVFEHAPRSRLSDIWSMGCILFDIVSRLHGYKLQELNRFWLLNGTMRDSYAENTAATEAWFTMLSDSSTPHKHASPSGLQWLLSFIKSLLLEPDRLMRPTAAQVVKRLDEASQDQSFYGHEGPLWMGSCCKLLATGSNGAVHSPLWREPLGRPSFDMFGTDIGFAQLFYDTDLRLIPCGDNVFNPGDSINVSFGDNNDFRDFNLRVKKLLDRVDIPSQERLSEVSQLSRAELMKSLYLHSACDIYYDNICLRLRLEGDLESYSYTARIVVVVLQLERRPMRGVPFITLVFDPEIPETLRPIYLRRAEL